MKNLTEKEKIIQDLKNIYKKLDISYIYGHPRQENTRNWIATLSSVFKKIGDDASYEKLSKLSDDILNPSIARKVRRGAAYKLAGLLKIKITELEKDDSHNSVKKKLSSETVGMLNEGKNNTYQSNKVIGFNIGFLDRGQKTKARNNIFYKNNKKPSPKWLLTPIVGLVVFAILIILLIGLEYKPDRFTVKPTYPFIEIDFTQDKVNNDLKQ